MRRRDPMGPPAWAEALLTAVVGSDDSGRSIVGDAREEFAARVVSGSATKAAVWYWRYVLWLTITYRTGGRPRAGGALGLVPALRQSGRALAKRPGLTSAVVVTLAVGLGATTMAFALVDGVLLRSLAYPDSEELVHVSRLGPDWFDAPPTAEVAGDWFATPPATFFDWRREARSFAHLGGYRWHSATLTGEGEPIRVFGIMSTSGVFEALGVSAAVGRHLLPEDDREGAAPAVVLSHGLWTRLLGGDPGVVGETLELDEERVTIVGVMPPSFAFPRRSADYWRSVTPGLLRDEARNAGSMHAVGRLAPGVSVEGAREEMEALTRSIAEVHPEEAEFEAYVFPLRDVTVAGSERGLVLLFAAAAVMLLVGCANVTGLFLARMVERRRELAVHAALGAGRGRLAGLVLGECLLMSIAGGGLGVLLAWVGLGPFVAILPMAVPRADELEVGFRALAAGFGLAVLAGVAMSVLPSRRALRTNLNDTLRDGGRRGGEGPGVARSHGALVSLEVALAVVLMSTSGLFLESFRQSAARDPGYVADGVSTARLSVAALSDAPTEEQASFFRELEERLRGLPGVELAASATQMPYGGGFSQPPVSIDTDAEVVETIQHTTAVSAEYFQALGIPVLAGRTFGPQDVLGTLPVTVVSEAMAERYWPGLDPIGRRIRLDDGPDPQWMEVIGVVGNVRYFYAGGEIPQYYIPFAQRPAPYASLVVKARSGMGGGAAPIREAIREVAPDLPVSVRALADQAHEDTAYRWAKMAAFILAGLAGTATLLAVLGIYGVLAYSVVRQTREIGIRLSLGETPGGALRVILRRGLSMAVVGVVLGVAVARITRSMAASALIGVAPTGPWVMISVVALTAGTSVLACLLPARRVLSIDPAVAFRSD